MLFIPKDITRHGRCPALWPFPNFESLLQTKLRGAAYCYRGAMDSGINTDGKRPWNPTGIIAALSAGVLNVLTAENTLAETPQFPGPGRVVKILLREKR